MTTLAGRHELFVRAPPDAVWRVHTNIEAWSQWQPDVAASHVEGPIATGTVFRWKSGGLSITSRIQHVETAREIAWNGTAIGTRAYHRWTLTPQEGGTLVSTEESMDGWLVALLKVVMPDFLNKSLMVWMNSLKERVELQEDAYRSGSA